VFLNTARNLKAAPPPLVAMAMHLQVINLCCDDLESV